MLTHRARHAVVAASALCIMAAPHADDSWPVAGRQGVVRMVIVPAGQARDKEAYERQIARLCEPGQTCFLNFYTNSTGVPPAVPLPDPISEEATAVFRRSMKQGAELFRWSCRLGVDPENCF
jgi:hypothetical protein